MSETNTTNTTVGKMRGSNASTCGTELALTIPHDVIKDLIIEHCDQILRNNGLRDKTSYFSINGLPGFNFVEVVYRYELQ